MTFSYLPGPSGGPFLLARPDLVLMTSASGEHLGALWAAVDAGAHGAGMLDALTVGGISRTPDFVLVAGLGQPSAVVMARGSLAATVSVSGDQRQIDGAGVSSWVETVIDGVTGCRLGTVGDGSDAVMLPLVGGVVVARAVAWGDLSSPATSGPAATVAPAPLPEPAPEPTPTVQPALEPAPEPQSVAEPAPPPQPAPEPEPVAAPPAVAETPHATLGGAAMTIAPPPETSLIQPGASSDAADPAPSGYDHLFGATVMRSVEGAAVRPEEEGADDAPATDRTVVVEDIAALRAQRRAERARAKKPSVVAPRFVVHLSDGRVEALDQSIIVGRSPSATRVSGSAVPRLVTVTTPNNDISRSHAQIGVEGDTVVVTDLHSMNGTLVTLPGKNPQRLREGEPTTVVVGTIIDLGDGATLTVKEA